jgi:hypothetical protein
MQPAPGRGRADAKRGCDVAEAEAVSLTEFKSCSVPSRALGRNDQQRPLSASHVTNGVLLGSVRKGPSHARYGTPDTNVPECLSDPFRTDYLVPMADESVPLEDGDHLPETVQLWPHPRRGPWRLALRWQVQKGRAEVVGIDLRSAAPERPRLFLQPPRKRGVPLTASLLRTLRIGQIAEQDRRDLAAFVSPAPLYSPRGKTAPRTAPDELRHVAEAYLAAVSHGQATGRAVAVAMNVEERQARKLIWRARSQGLLPPTKSGTVRGSDRPGRIER